MKRHLISAGAIACGLLIVSTAIAQQQGQAQEQQGVAQVKTLEGAPAIQLDQHQTPLITVMYGPQGQQTRITAWVTNPQSPGQDRQITFDGQQAQNRVIRHEGQQIGQGQRIIFTAKRGDEELPVEQIHQREGIVLLGVLREDPRKKQLAQQQEQERLAAEQRRQQEQQQAQAQQQQQQAQQQAQADQADQAAQQQAQDQQAQAAAGQQAQQGQQGQQAQAQQQGEQGQAQQAQADAQAQQDQQAQLAAEQQRRQQEEQRRAQEPKPDRYDAIITVYMTTGR